MIPLWYYGSTNLGNMSIFALSDAISMTFWYLSLLVFCAIEKYLFCYTQRDLFINLQTHLTFWLPHLQPSLSLFLKCRYLFSPHIHSFGLPAHPPQGARQALSKICLLQCSNHPCQKIIAPLDTCINLFETYHMLLWNIILTIYKSYFTN